MNKKKFMLLSAIAMLGFGAIAPISNTNDVQAATPYVDKDNVLHDYGQKNDGVNLNKPLDSYITGQTTALRQGAWRVYIDPHFSKNDKKELVEAIHAWQKKGVHIYRSMDKSLQMTDIFFEKPSKKYTKWMMKKHYLGLSQPNSNPSQPNSNYTKIVLATGYIRRSNGDYVHVSAEHELGHAFGMMHSLNKRSVMYYSDAGNNKIQYITKNDAKVARYLQKCLLDGNYYHAPTQTVTY